MLIDGGFDHDRSLCFFYGLEQLARYLESESLDQGYLIVFDRWETKMKQYTFSEYEVGGKQVFAWVV